MCGTSIGMAFARCTAGTTNGRKCWDYCATCLKNVRAEAWDKCAKRRIVPTEWTQYATCGNPRCASNSETAKRARSARRSGLISGQHPTFEVKRCVRDDVAAQLREITKKLKGLGRGMRARVLEALQEDVGLEARRLLETCGDDTWNKLRGAGRVPVVDVGEVV